MKEPRKFSRRRHYDRDTICIAGTDMGKTVLFWLPLLFRPTGIQIVVTRSTERRVPSKVLPPLRSPHLVTHRRHCPTTLTSPSCEAECSVTARAPHLTLTLTLTLTDLISPSFAWRSCANTNGNALCIPVRVCMRVSSLLSPHSLTLAVSSRCHLTSRRRPPCIATAQCV